MSYKGFLIRDSEWDPFWDAVDDAVEKPGGSSKEAVCMHLRTMLRPRLVYQCTNCGRLHVMSGGRICSFVRETADGAGSVFD